MDGVEGKLSSLLQYRSEIAEEEKVIIERLIERARQKLVAKTKEDLLAVLGSVPLAISAGRRNEVQVYC